MAAPKKKSKSVFRRIVGWFKEAAKWVTEVLTDDEIARSIREDLGLPAGGKIPADKEAKFKQLAAGLDPEREALSDSIAEITGIANETKALAAALSNGEPTQIHYFLMKAAATDSVRLRVPALFALGKVMSFVEDDVESLALLDPARALRNVRGEDLPASEVLAERISGAGALALILLDAFIGTGDDKEAAEHLDVFYGWDISPDSVTPKAASVQARTMTLSIGRDQPTDAGLDGRVLVSTMFVPAAHGGPGIFASLGGAIVLEATADTLRYRLEAGLAGGLDIFIPFGESPRNFEANAGGNAAPFLKFGIRGGEVDEPAFRLGEKDRTRLDVYETELGIDVWKENAGFHAALRNAELVLVPPDTGFMRTLFGNGAKIRFSVGIIADSDGFRLDGGTNARATLTIGRSLLGVLNVHHLEVALGPSSTGGDLGLELSGGFTLKLGAFSASVDRLGFQLDADRRPGGNFGPFHFDLGFKPPNGIGLAADFLGFVEGGGYLFSDPANKEFAGALELTLFNKVGVKAIGILADRPTGWSLLLFVYVEFGPVQLGAGFTLDGAGGMIGIEHSVALDKLIAGMKTGAFDDILFPKHPVADAPRIINRLRELFPATDNVITVGPMLDIGFGSPRIVYIRIGVLFSINRGSSAGSGLLVPRIALIGQLKVEIGPTKDKPNATIVKLTVDILGFWDREQKRYGFIAALRDSKIATVNITGGIAIFGEYGASQRFMLAAGGFNPRFTDVPAVLGSGGGIDRLGAAFKVGRFELKLAGYFAITPGTVQFGVQLGAKAKIGPVALEGLIGFDALIYFEPYTHFIVDFRVKLSVSYKGHTLAGVKVEGTIEGPGLWHIVGSVTFSILFWDISKHFDESWGTAPAVVSVSTNVQALLTDAMNRRENWTAQLPASDGSMVTLAQGGADKAFRAHPLGRVAFSQRVVPFGVNLERFGNTRVAGPARFDITRLTIGGAEITRAAVREQFARAQFVDQNEDEKLTRPSFEPMESGAEFSSASFRSSPGVLAVDMEYETAYLDFDEKVFNTTRRDPRLNRAGLDFEHVAALSRLGAAGRAPQRANERRGAAVASRLRIDAPSLAAADRTAFAPDATIDLSGQARTVALVAEQRMNHTDHARSQLVESFELVGA